MKSNCLKFTTYQVEALVIWHWFKLLSLCVFICRNPLKYVSTRHCTWTVLCQLFPSLVYVWLKDCIRSLLIFIDNICGLSRFLGRGLQIWTQRFCCTWQSGLAWISIWMTYFFLFSLSCYVHGSRFYTLLTQELHWLCGSDSGVRSWFSMFVTGSDLQKPMSDFRSWGRGGKWRWGRRVWKRGDVLDPDVSCCHVNGHSTVTIWLFAWVTVFRIIYGITEHVFHRLMFVETNFCT